MIGCHVVGRIGPALLTKRRANPFCRPPDLATRLLDLATKLYSFVLDLSDLIKKCVLETKWLHLATDQILEK